MNFVKPRKHLDERDAKEPLEKSRRDRYQRSDSARLLLQANIAHQSKTQIEGTVFKQISTAESSRNVNVGLLRDSRSDFKPEELPDGAFYRPKKDLNNLQPASTAPATSSQDVSDTGNKFTEHTRRAEYIGTFSVSGSDKEARERQMESQLEQMRSAKDRMPVNLTISNSGVKVVNHENNDVFMEHSLKRIWYATCDPEYCQFSFLAREPKTSAEVQYCHAFVTQTAEQAEELIAAIGEAFKSTDNETKKPPTFHELIEQQVQQQQAKFRETEKEAKSALQQKLKEIATPTPFSEKAQIRMEQRRKSEDVVLLVGQDKMLAKQQEDQQGGKQALGPEKTGNNLPGNRRSEIPTRQSILQAAPLKRNSVPPQAALLSSLVPSSSPSANTLSVLAIKESIETRNSNSKFKGSPVTALKNEIDRRLSIPNGEILHPPIDRELRKDQVKPPKPQPKAMTNRPLPLPPSTSKSPQQSRHQPGGQQPLQQSQPLQSPLPQQPQHALLRHSLDDYHIPRSVSSQIPLSSNARSGAGNVIMRNSPKRRQPRPMSDIATSSNSAAGTGAVRGFSDQQLQQQGSLNNFAAGFNLPTHSETGSDGLYVYGPSSCDQEKQQGLSRPQSKGGHRSSKADSGCADAVAEGKEDSGGYGRCDEAADTGLEAVSDRLTHCFKKQDGVRPFDSSQTPTRQGRIQGHAAKPGLVLVQPTQVSKLGNSCNPDTANVAVPRYQNDSPFQNDRPEKGARHIPGFESLMGLDRSHIHDEALRNAQWYHAGLPREIALDILQQEEVGSFIVRDSTSHPGCFALSVRVPKFENASGISHYLVLRTHRGVKLKGLDKEWSTLTALVTHHTVMRELLPCTLRVPKVKAQETQSSSGQIRSCGSTSNDDVGNNLDGNIYDQS